MAQYLNDLAELDPSRGVSVWLVEARAVRIQGSPWAPLFSSVVEPNVFTATVEQAKQSEKPGSIDELLAAFKSDELRAAAAKIVSEWVASGFRRRLGPSHVVLEAPGPSVNGYRTVVALSVDGRVLVPFGAYQGQNSGISIPALTTDHFRATANSLFGFNGTEVQARTVPGWLTPDRVDSLLDFCLVVANAYKAESQNLQTASHQ